MSRVKVVVVGAGVIGLTSALCIAESLPNVVVTIIAENFSPDTTSDGAAGILSPSHFPEIPVERQRRWFKHSFHHLLEVAHSADAPHAGVMLSSGCEIYKQVPSVKRPFWSDLVIGFREMSVSELQRFPEHSFGQVFTTLKCECSRYLPWIQHRFVKAGGVVEQRRVSSLEELSGFDLIVNCSGLGSRTLAQDSTVYPVRGQVLKVSAPWIQHFIFDGDGKTYIYPGIESVTLGGTKQEQDWRLEVDEQDTTGILERCKKLEPSLENAKVQSKWVGLRPSRKCPRVEREVVQMKGKKMSVVHNYGHGACGVTLAWGCAVDTLGLVKQSLQEISPMAKL
ncbi:D-aspartate oxidase-like [Boleophthalmus pectinirostris]|uniref:D-aspartate oxidase-like n=1 Tax=Boleophthalmus pectinirostris TaxID=150288 RepID=UPI002432ACD0|nr:D-aspartate oxidase-like [Boleophthalmus pectinirostris]